MSDERDVKIKDADEINEPDVEAHQRPKASDEADDETPDVEAHQRPKQVQK